MKSLLKSLLMKMRSKGRWKIKFPKIVADFATAVGLFWLVVEMASYSTDSEIDAYTKSVCFFLISFSGILLGVLIKNIPKYTFKYKLRDKDKFITLKVGDAFKNKGALVVPINDCLDVSLGGNVKKANSLQNKLIQEYYSGKEEHLATDIASKNNVQSPQAIGTVVEIDQKSKTFYLLVNSRKKTNNRVESTIDDFGLCIESLWRYIAEESGRHGSITIPLISTNHGRVPNLNRTVAIKEIIDSYIEACKNLNVADELIISLHPGDIEKGEINLDELDEFLRLSCKHYKHTTFVRKIEGEAEEVTASQIANISH